ncbi:MAG: hypothetical protein D4R84_06220, partial [Rhodocyclaceae bacterium]
MSTKSSSPPLSQLSNAAKAEPVRTPANKQAARSAQELLDELQARQVQLEVENAALRISLVELTHRQQLT